ncbi:zinc transporter ZIP6 [Brachyistius frenatus]|uniref:zinc transporter ZIP6 n=1 Tax=Brachyistius frenatus TaxID=100188 RepID=UPI0037E9872C
MTNEEKTAAVVALMCLFVLSGASDGSDCTTEASGAAWSVSATVDLARAERSQRQHLEALFNRYGENGTISLAGLKRLLQSVGLHRFRTVTVQHHEHAGCHDHGHRHRDDGHRHHDGHRHQHRCHRNDSSAKESKNADGRLDAYEEKSAAGREAVGTATHGVQPAVRAQDSRPEKASPSGEGTPAGGVPGSRTQAAAVGRVDDHDHHHEHDHLSPDHVECLNASSILSSHGMSQEMGVTLGDFGFLCPALLRQIDSSACILHEDRERDHKHHNHTYNHYGNHTRPHQNHSQSNGTDGGKSIAEAWVGGFLSITIISLLSLLGVVLIPLMNRVFFKFLLSFLVALAVGTLSGDAFLHLIPHSQGGHHHNHDNSSDDEAHHLHDGGGGGGHRNLDPVWKGLTALSGVYVMFLIEHFLTLGKMYKDKKQKIQKKWDQNDKADPEKQPALEENDLKPSEDVETNGGGTFGDHPRGGGGVAEEEQVMLAPQVSVVSPPGYGRSSGGGAAAYTAEDCENKCHSHFHDTVGQADSMHHHHHDYHHILHHHHSQNHHPHSHSHSYSEQHFQQAGVATLAWMVLMGDGLHNFSDGLAIGAAFTDGVSSGLSTSVAVFCHELPHELGDFAVLLKAGMTVRQAILYNVLSAMMAYLGLVTGILIGHYADNISMWIFALTAGLFMYVALVDMVPEMLHNDAGDHGFSHCGFFLLQNAGILLGFCIMLLIAIFEHKITGEE